MPTLSPGAHLQAYRTSGNSVFFGISGSSANVVSSVSVSSGGTYTSTPSVNASGGGGSGFIGSAVMGLKTILFTPQSVSSSAIEIVSDGVGGEVAASFGGPDITPTQANYFNPASYSLSVAGGSGATYRIWFSVFSIGVTGGSGEYTSKPTLTIAGDASVEPLFKFSSITFPEAVFSVQGSLSSCFGAAAEIAISGNSGQNFSINMLYRPKLWAMGNVDATYQEALYWDPSAHAAPTFSIAPQTNGSGAVLTPRYMLAANGNTPYSSFELTDVGYGYDDVVDIAITGGGLPAGMSVTGTISPGQNGELDISTLQLGGSSHLGYGDLAEWRGYFSSKPTITLTPQGNGQGAVLEISKMRLVQIEASSGSGYTKSDIGLLATAGRIANTSSLINHTGSVVSPVGLVLQYAQVYSSTISNEGSNYLWEDSPAWSTAGFFTLNNGVPTQGSEPALTVKRKISSVAVQYGGYYSTSSIPSISITSPQVGSSPTFSIVALVDAIENTARGSGYTAQQVTSSGFFSNPQMTVVANGFSAYGVYLQSLSVVSAGAGYKTSDQVIVGTTAFAVSELSVTSVLVSAGGSAYTTAPTISFSGGGQIVSASASATISAVTPSTSSLPGLVLSDVNPATGDARKIALEIVECFYKIFQKDESVIGSRVSASKRIGFSQLNLQREITYQFEFEVEMSGAQTLVQEA